MNHKKKTKREMPAEGIHYVKIINDFTSSMNSREAELILWENLERIIDSNTAKKWSNDEYSDFFTFSMLLSQAIQNMFRISQDILMAASRKEKINIYWIDYSHTVENFSEFYGIEGLNTALDKYLPIFSEGYSKSSCINLDRAETHFVAKNVAQLIQAIAHLKNTVFEQSDKPLK